MQDTVRVFLMNGIEPWYQKYLLPFLSGLIIGVISFFLSQLFFRNRDRNRAREQYIGYLTVIGGEIKRNLDLLTKLHAYLYVGILPSFGLSFFINDGIFANLPPICKNFKLLNKIFEIYFQYNHIQNRIDRLKKLDNEFYAINSQIPLNQETKHLKENEIRYAVATTIKLIGDEVRDSFYIYHDIVREIGLFEKKEYLNELPANHLEERYYLLQKKPIILAAETNLKKQDANFDLGKRPKFYEK